MAGQGSLTHFPHGVASFGIPLVGSSDYTTTGSVFFVDSGSTTGGDNAAKGQSPDTPFLTIDFAVGRCAASNGDIIFVMPGHAENISTATSLVIDVVGVRIIGMGWGRTRPVLTYTATAGSIEMDAASCTLENIVFVASVSAVVVGINVDAADCSVIGCEFDFDATLDDFITVIDIDTVDRAAVINCRFIAEGATGVAEAIRLDTADECQVIGNKFTGDFTDGCIVMEGAASDSVEIRENYMWNGHANALGIVNSVISSGIIKDNTLSYEQLFAQANQLLATTSGSTLNWQVTKHASSAFTGGSVNQHGNDGGTGDPYTVFTVTGDVLISAFWGVINTDLTGATATVEVGTVGGTATILAQELGTDMDDGALYVDATVADGVGVLANAGAHFVINDGADIIETIGTADVTAGQIDYYCIWAPAEDGASITSADAVV